MNHFMAYLFFKKTLKTIEIIIITLAQKLVSIEDLLLRDYLFYYVKIS